MSQSAISNRLTSLNGFKGKELDLHAKLSIQAKQNALPKGTICLFRKKCFFTIFLDIKKIN